MRQNGNLKCNRLYNPDESANPPPMNMVSTERDGELERFLRGVSIKICVRSDSLIPWADIAKYQYKQFVVKRLSSFSQQDAVVPSRRIESAPTQLLPDSSQKLRPLGTSERRKSPSLFPAMGEDGKLRSTSQPLSSPVSIASAGQPKTASGGGVWDELISLQGPTQNSSLPLQFQPLCSASTPNTPLSTPMSMQYLVPGTLTGMPGNLPGNLFNAPNTTLATVTQPPLEQSACVTSSSLFPSQAATYPLPSPSLFQWTSSQHLPPMLAPFCAPTMPQTSTPSTPLMTGHPLPTQPFVASPHVGLGPTAFIQPQPQLQPPMEILNQDRLNEWQDSHVRQGF